MYVLKNMLNLGWTTPEQDFQHHAIMRDAGKLDKEQLLEIFGVVHKQYQLRSHLFSKLIRWCARNQVTLPPFAELLEPSDSSHPLESERNLVD